MTVNRTSNVRTCAIALATGALVLTACSEGGGSSDDNAKEPSMAAQGITLGTAADSTGPAKEVPGAKQGGTVQVLQRDAYEYLDPGQIYVSDELIMQTVYNRTLTNYQVDDKTGRTKLVGDLATDTGTSSDGGKTWTYKLKDGLKFQDGTPITTKDVRHSIERLYHKSQTNGPTYLQQWLSGEGQSYRKALPDGPYKGDHLPASVLDTPDDKTLIFHFNQPRAEVPFAVAMPNIGAVPPDKDSPKYNKKPISSGPYKVANFKPGKGITFVRNEHWDPKTDPIRHQYVDKFEVSFGHQWVDSTRRLLADKGADQHAMTWNNAVDPAQISTVLKDKKALARSLTRTQPYVDVVSINTSRVKNKKVREALAWAFPNGQYLQQYGGPKAGEIAGSLVGPTLKGHNKGFDPFQKKKYPGGNIAKAKELLKEAGEEGYPIVYAYGNDKPAQDASVVVERALESAGFTVEKKELDRGTYYTQIGKVNNTYDLYRSSWSADWPSGSTVVPTIYGGKNVYDDSPNYSHLNSPAINKEIERIAKIEDVDQAAPEWVTLGERILTEEIPQVPVFYNRLFTLWGSGIGGVKFHEPYGAVDPTAVFVK
ncbi:ABC transporter substrate-binding protein [Streptomyces zagrosensis]|uniref:Peptide/nickel transport system substrate-binding protein n=1 Tax=Streptomyces zagrosensis TaxID=1042984 RepID=A0A7W9QCZ9_9ACTN|nr:ABC transporter substrate-binding protein [Streptomyces zagrosensis]MBB5936742.1 peptide/nickel transport system substrate-binding protein [Streptomyces zagrosensis]